MDIGKLQLESICFTDCLCTCRVHINHQQCNDIHGILQLQYNLIKGHLVYLAVHQWREGSSQWCCTGIQCWELLPQHQLWSPSVFLCLQTDTGNSHWSAVEVILESLSHSAIWESTLKSIFFLYRSAYIYRYNITMPMKKKLKHSQSQGHPGQTGWGWLWLRYTDWSSAPISLAPMHSDTGTSENTCSPQYTSHIVDCCNWCSAHNQ